MSGASTINPLVIAAATATLRRLLARIGEGDAAVNGGKGAPTVTTRPPDLVQRSRGDAAPAQLNIFLYHVALDGSLRQVDVSAPSGTRASTPLSLRLSYLISAYASDDHGGNDDSDNDLSSDRLLGAAMGVLHDAAELTRADIDAALGASDLAHQLERMRVMPQPLSLDHACKLWSACQAPYRISAAYEVCVTPVERRPGGADAASGIA